MYGDLVYATPGLQPDQVGRYFKDATFGVRAEDVERRYSPRADVTIVRDKGFGVPHVYGATRDGAMFGLGYAAAEDRLFFMDVLRHAGRGELAGFAGGANAAMDAEQWEVAPYTEADLQRQADQLDDVLGAAGATIQRDVEHYIAGINAYISEAKLDPAKMPGEYPPSGGRRAPTRGRRPTCSRPRRSSAGSSARAAAPSSSGARSAGRCATASAGAAGRACSATSARPRTPRRR